MNQVGQMEIPQVEATPEEQMEIVEKPLESLLEEQEPQTSQIRADHRTELEMILIEAESNLTSVWHEIWDTIIRYTVVPKNSMREKIGEILSEEQIDVALEAVYTYNILRTAAKMEELGMKLVNDAKELRKRVTDYLNHQNSKR